MSKTLTEKVDFYIRIKKNFINELQKIGKYKEATELTVNKIQQKLEKTTNNNSESILDWANAKLLDGESCFMNDYKNQDAAIKKLFKIDNKETGYNSLDFTLLILICRIYHLSLERILYGESESKFSTPDNHLHVLGTATNDNFYTRIFYGKAHIPLTEENLIDTFELDLRDKKATMKWISKNYEYQVCGIPIVEEKQGCIHISFSANDGMFIFMTFPYIDRRVQDPYFIKGFFIRPYSNDIRTPALQQFIMSTERFATDTTEDIGSTEVINACIQGLLKIDIYQHIIINKDEADKLSDKYEMVKKLFDVFSHDIETYSNIKNSILIIHTQDIINHWEYLSNTQKEQYDINYLIQALLILKSISTYDTYQIFTRHNHLEYEFSHCLH